MIVRKRWVAGLAIAGALVGCGDGGRPPAVAGGDSGIVINPVDLGTVTIPDGGAVDVPLPMDTPPTDNGPRPDVPVNPSDAGDAGLTDAGGMADLVIIPFDTGPDAGHRVRAFCGFTRLDTLALAVRAATCLNQAPQTVLNEMFRPSYWQGGLLPSRSCSALGAALADTNGCPGFLASALKIEVQPTTTGTCDGATTSCGANSGGRAATVSCSNGLTITDVCEAVTGSNDCVSSTGAAGCRPQPLDTAACTDATPTRCYNGLMQRCVGGTYVNQFDCDPGLANCDATAGTCVGTGVACTGDVDRCDGSRIQQCRGGRLHSVDCASLVPGTNCRSQVGNSYCGTAFDCDPNAAPANGTCDGNNLVLCVGGTEEHFNCVAAGFVGCGVGGCTH